jgi:hypothetical protein
MATNSNVSHVSSVRTWVLLALTVVIAVTAFGGLVVAIDRVKQAAHRTAALNNLGQIARAVGTFHDSLKCLPPAIGKSPWPWGVHGTVHQHIRPFVQSEMEADQRFWERVDIALPYYVVPGDPTWNSGEIYDGKYGTTNFAANWLAFHGGPQKDGKTTLTDSFPDGTANTVLFAFRQQMCNGTPTLWGYDKFDPKAPLIGYYNTDPFQIRPSQKECNPTVANTYFSSLPVAMADFSVHVVSADVNSQTWAALLTPAGNDIIGAHLND